MQKISKIFLIKNILILVLGLLLISANTQVALSVNDVQADVRKTDDLVEGFEIKPDANGGPFCNNPKVDFTDEKFSLGNLSCRRGSKVGAAKKHSFVCYRKKSDTQEELYVLMWDMTGLAKIADGTKIAGKYWGMGKLSGAKGDEKDKLEAWYDPSLRDEFKAIDDAPEPWCWGKGENPTDWKNLGTGDLFKIKIGKPEFHILPILDENGRAVPTNMCGMTTIQPTTFLQFGNDTIKAHGQKVLWAPRDWVAGGRDVHMLAVYREVQNSGPRAGDPLLQTSYIDKLKKECPDLEALKTKKTGDHDTCWVQSEHIRKHSKDKKNPYPELYRVPLGTLIQEAWDEHLPNTDTRNVGRAASETEKASWVWKIRGPHWFEYYPGYPSKHFVQICKVEVDPLCDKKLAEATPVQKFLDKTETEIKENIDIQGTVPPEFMHEFIEAHVKKYYRFYGTYTTGFKSFATYYMFFHQRLKDGVRDPYYNARWLVSIISRRQKDFYAKWNTDTNKQGPRLAMQMTQDQAWKTIWNGLKLTKPSGTTEQQLRTDMLIDEHLFNMSIDAEKNDNQNIDGAEWFIKKFLQHDDGWDQWWDSPCLAKDCPEVKCHSSKGLSQVLSVEEKSKHNWAQGKQKDILDEQEKVGFPRTKLEGDCGLKKEDIDKAQKNEVKNTDIRDAEWLYLQIKKNRASFSSCGEYYWNPRKYSKPITGTDDEIQEKIKNMTLSTFLEHLDLTDFDAEVDGEPKFYHIGNCGISGALIHDALDDPARIRSSKLPADPYPTGWYMYKMDYKLSLWLQTASADKLKLLNLMVEEDGHGAYEPYCYINEKELETIKTNKKAWEYLSAAWTAVGKSHSNIVETPKEDTTLDLNTPLDDEWKKESQNVQNHYNSAMKEFNDDWELPTEYDEFDDVEVRAVKSVKVDFDDVGTEIGKTQVVFYYESGMCPLYLIHKDPPVQEIEICWKAGLVAKQVAKMSAVNSMEGLVGAAEKKANQEVLDNVVGGKVTHKTSASGKQYDKNQVDGKEVSLSCQKHNMALGVTDLQKNVDDADKDANQGGSTSCADVLTMGSDDKDKSNVMKCFFNVNTELLYNMEFQCWNDSAKHQYAEYFAKIFKVMAETWKYRIWAQLGDNDQYKDYTAEHNKITDWMKTTNGGEPKQLNFVKNTLRVHRLYNGEDLTEAQLQERLDVLVKGDETKPKA